MTGFQSVFTGERRRLNNKIIPELLVPANNLEVLKYAVEYGADAVYIGGRQFNLRSLGENFSIDELKSGIEYAHKKGVSVYLTLNAVIHDDELEALQSYIKSLKKVNPDGLIISDMGVIYLAKRYLPGINIHISTQANITNQLAVKAAEEMGASRVNISRELSYDSLKGIVKNSNIEIEVFAHGALCISYSGRCMLSRYMTGRDANKGECAHSCRWKYYLMEEERSNLFFPIEQDKKGTYIYNSRDLCLLQMLDRIVDAGVQSIKIEGRMKTESYVSLVTWVYRRALDLISEGNFNRKNIVFLMEELDKASHRNFTTGFMFSKDKSELEDNDNVGYIKKYDFIGTCHGYNNKYNGPVINVKNQFNAGKAIDILQPYVNPKRFLVKKIVSASENAEVACANPNDRVIICGLGRVDPFSIFRIKR